MNRRKILDDLEASYEQQRRLNSEEEDRRRCETEAKIPGLSELLQERMNLIYGSVRGILAGRNDSCDLPMQMELINQSISQKLLRAGYPVDWLNPVYKCKLCHDTGFTGETIREMCSCMRSAYNERLYASIGLNHTGEESFERFDLMKFPDKAMQGTGVSQRQMMAVARKSCEKWADDYPYTEKRDMVFSGKSGLGKTYMMHAIAKRLLERGHDVLIVSSYAFLQAARKAAFGRTEDSDTELRSMIEADVLMLDDLGAEPMLEGITIVQLFNLINERQLSGRSTVISTNLNEKELQERYSERVASRMLDKRCCALIPFAG